MKTALFLSIALLCAASFASAQNTSSAGNANNGKRLFIKDGCYGCHGYDGHGGTGARLAPKPLATAAFTAYVRHPGPSGMPVFTPKVISDADLNDIWAYLKSIPDSPAVKDIPLLNQ